MPQERTTAGNSLARGSERSDQVVPPADALFDGAAVGTDPGDNEPVAGDAEAVVASHAVPQVHQLVALKFNQALALFAVQVIVLRVTLVVFVHIAPANLELA